MAERLRDQIAYLFATSVDVFASCRRLNGLAALREGVGGVGAKRADR